MRNKSGRVMGVHQRIDRVASRHIARHVPKSLHFPTAREIVHFEGLNGPDGIKRKSPGIDEPWHFIDPYHKGDHQLLVMIEDHIYNLAQALRTDNRERAAFEAAWLAHAVVDGLTPAHHYPLEEKLEELRGEGMETRNSKKDKLLMPGKTRRHQIKNNWEFWGAKGVMTTHLSFELGVSTSIAALRFDDIELPETELHEVALHGFEPTFKRLLKEIAAMKMYDEFSKLGWTRHIARETRQVLVPVIIKAVALAWYDGIVRAGKIT